MLNLTSQLLDTYPYFQHTDLKTIERGRAYYKEGRVWDATFSKNKTQAVCQVDGDSGEYTVEIGISQESGQIYFDCDCPYGADHFCKHMVAAALEVSARLKDEVNSAKDDKSKSFLPARPQPQPLENWQAKLNETLAQVSRRAPTNNHGRYVALVVVARSQYSYYGYGSAPHSYSLEPFMIKGREWDLMVEGELKSAQEINDFLRTNKRWIKVGERLTHWVNPAGCLNLSPEAVSFLNVLQSIGRMYGVGSSGMSMYLSTLAKLGVPVFLGNTYSPRVDQPLHILPNPVELQIDMREDVDQLVLQVGFQNGEVFTPITSKIEPLSSDPTWVLMDEHVAEIRNSQVLSILPSFPIEIPAGQVDSFREGYFARIAQLFSIKNGLIHWHDIKADLTPRLYLHDDQDNILRADLRFGYGEHELGAVKSGEAYAIETVPDSWDLLRIQRDLEREQHFYHLLTDPAYHLKRAGTDQPFGTLELRAHTHPFDFLMHAIPQLTQAGFEIYGEENLKLGRINRNTPTLRVYITSGIDWFDLKTFVEFGDQQISFHDVRKALKRGEHYIKLADGSVGQIPEAWLEKYKHLWNLAEETKDGYRVSDFHLPLIDALLEEDAMLQVPPDLAGRRDRLRTFERIVPQPLPKGFTGELRPYQKHGFDWLHFLREYQFGGILADDMGLGKTVQMLAYLLSLKEARAEQRKPSRKPGRNPATLLVVPKSLIANWQRESEKFTPDLRFLEYVGNARAKDASTFDEYDIVLTTYGTMLRDIEILRGYQFSHVILDESQAIKNPLAKSSKAARLLKAEHRIVMTGTPVENNTFELWSQFAFLNPGLLGNMDYFKRAFANPIESGGDQISAATLRSLVYPFILRRTKEQVAPELPPRTERIIYTDMNAAQKKLYTHTRERYRAELLGLIESDGMNDARFKILEGLLRLRQIAIHPALVDKKYKGEAPKFEVLLETLETLQTEHHKALIFSQFVETLKLVRRELDERKMKYIYLDGKTPNRQARVDSFQNDSSYPFFLISLKTGGVGLNLTAADYVIHLDPWWNPAVEMQASDRAHRIGQDKPVFIYKIIAHDTVEEKILQLQEKKRALVKSILSTEGSFFKSLTKDDVKMLFA